MVTTLSQERKNAPHPAVHPGLKSESISQYITERVRSSEGRQDVMLACNKVSMFMWKTL